MVRLETIERLDQAVQDRIYHGIYRQALINGNFDIWQRGASFGAGDAQMSADMWGYYAKDSSGITRQSFTVGQTDVPNEPAYFLRFTTAGQGDAGDLSVLTQKIEDVRTLAGKTVSLSFWAKADSACNIAIEFAQSFGTGGSSGVFSIGSQKKAITTSWTKLEFTVDIPSIAGKTVGTNSNLTLHIWCSAGSGFNARTNSLGLQNRVIDIAQVQLNEGSVVLPFCPKPLTEELLRCWRYYYRINYTESYDSIGHGMGRSATSIDIMIYTPVPMYKKPTISYSNIGHFLVGDTVGGYTCTNKQAGANDRYNNRIYATVFNIASGGVQYRPYSFIFSTTSSAWFALEAEL